MRSIRKQVFLSALECPAKGWKLHHGLDAPELSLCDEFRMRQGGEIGQRARHLFPGGVLVAEAHPDQALRRTRAILESQERDTIFEAMARYGALSARADILTRLGDGWRLIEVKSALSDKAEYQADLAYTVMVFRNSGLDITRASLLLLSKEYRLGDPPEALFVQVDKTTEIMSLSQEMFKAADQVAAILAAGEAPEARLSPVCRHCEFFSSACIGYGIHDPVFNLPRLHKNKVVALSELGVVSLADLPPDFDLTENQQRVYRAFTHAESWIGPGLAPALAGFESPVYYLDFETTQTAVPLYPGVAPYAQVPTQYSIHLHMTPETPLQHREFLADPARDCSRELAEKLLDDLGGQGSILVYTRFEQTILNQLAGSYPDLTPELAAIVARLVDLEAIIRLNYYHPGFHGSTSIKVTLPALAPHSSYAHLAVQDGETASVLFAQMAQGRYTREECQRIQADLRAYCRQDTQGMVDLHRALLSIVA